ncbi:hypothetical protein ACI3PL_32805, partial [Lacticaseibacillus paracasei]
MVFVFIKPFTKIGLMEGTDTVEIIDVVVIPGNTVDYSYGKYMAPETKVGRYVISGPEDVVT